MDTINWHEVTEKIRTRKFNEITDEAWSQIAKKIEPKKRGRKPKPILEGREDWPLEDLDDTDKKYSSIVAKYDRLRLNDVKSKKAFELIADNLDASGNPDRNGPKVLMTASNVERIVYSWIKARKELDETMQEELRLENIQ